MSFKSRSAYFSFVVTPDLEQGVITAQADGSLEDFSPFILAYLLMKIFSASLWQYFLEGFLLRIFKFYLIIRKNY